MYVCIVNRRMRAMAKWNVKSDIMICSSLTYTITAGMLCIHSNGAAQALLPRQRVDTGETRLHLKLMPSFPVRSESFVPLVARPFSVFSIKWHWRICIYMYYIHPFIFLCIVLQIRELFSNKSGKWNEFSLCGVMFTLHDCHCIRGFCCLVNAIREHAGHFFLYSYINQNNRWSTNK